MVWVPGLRLPLVLATHDRNIEHGETIANVNPVRTLNHVEALASTPKFMPTRGTISVVIDNHENGDLCALMSVGTGAGLSQSRRVI